MKFRFLRVTVMREFSQVCYNFDTMRDLHCQLDWRVPSEGDDGGDSPPSSSVITHDDKRIRLTGSHVRKAETSPAKSDWKLRVSVLRNRRQKC